MVVDGIVVLILHDVNVRTCGEFVCERNLSAQLIRPTLLVTLAYPEGGGVTGVNPH